MEHINFKSDQSLDQIKHENIVFFMEAIPWIDWKEIDKNLLFIELLNEYRWKDFRWIENFLNKKNYDTEAVRLLKQKEDWSCLSAEEQIEAKKWDLFVWLKPFIYDYWTEKQSQYVYLVLAKKKKRFNMDTIKDTVMETLFWNKYSRENN